MWHSVCHVELIVNHVVIYVGLNVSMSRSLMLVVSYNGCELLSSVFLLFWALIVLAVVCSVLLLQVFEPTKKNSQNAVSPMINVAIPSY